MIPALPLFPATLRDPKVPEGFVIANGAEPTYPMFAGFDDPGGPHVPESSGGTLFLPRQDVDPVVPKDPIGAGSRFRRDRLRELKRGDASLIPEALERNLAEAEIRDLLATLQELR